MTRGPQTHYLSAGLVLTSNTWHASVGHNETRWYQLSPSVRILSVWVSDSAEADK